MSDHAFLAISISSMLQTALLAMLLDESEYKYLKRKHFFIPWARLWTLFRYLGMVYSLAVLALLLGNTYVTFRFYHTLFEVNNR